MTRLEKITEVEKAILELEMHGDVAFFSRTLPEKMEVFIALCSFDDIKNENLNQYLSPFIKFYKSDIIWSRAYGSTGSLVRQFSFFRSCKEQTNNLKEIIILGFKCLVGSCDRLNNEEG